ncbi:zinc-finger protein conserved [Leishmania donovani]|uniref:Zinc-finger_protein_-_conserved n=3 Tax=Leishmania donovani species complex TaxID=38574 RepID=A0A6L0XJT2_LEIIN|nr:conserved zinc-finger protein [Leishmania infantum JPCM5]XP_003862938.1 zinc-finger protein, conserved [Leishmania donovani]CAC9514509.1 zinc-finger_protein_-_conserved [Leishmania infantum]AYU81025.1 zinc-finger protein, conserved [Leishmania donovani]TPP43298.1 C2H2 type zinc-finger (2 copies) family protein [Leishmania donovani]TPP45788.1 C2H2 type zinc-finger (2 copies) family protein [Leishmania donovani]CAJ1991018.1 zinc-finger protein conserved [Leishmania donovani]|eukprot:XP_001467072.1 conserved zinc-finger protein [Leishmania infantum JPCM5]
MSRCGTCNVVLENGEVLRAHYGSEFHLTNVRRRVDGLRPLSQQDHRFSRNEMEGAVLGEKGTPVYSCTLCKKTFHSVQTLQTHIRSTAHLMRKEKRIIARDSETASMLTSTSLGSAAMGLHRRHNAKKSAAARGDAKPKTAPKVDAEEREEDASELRCMFCGFLSADVGSNVHHLECVHSFTIPLTAHCTNQAALLAYLARKINGLMCIVCNERTRSFSSLEALRDHMRETNHERLILSPEYQEFYDVVLEDPEAARPVQLEGVRGDELVLAHDKALGKRRVVLKRENDVPRARPRETEEHNEKRMAILAEEQETRALARQEQKELIMAQNKEAAWVAKRSGGDRHNLQLDVSMRTNRLHPKGYDGNMMFS